MCLKTAYTEMLNFVSIFWGEYFFLLFLSQSAKIIIINNNNNKQNKTKNKKMQRNKPDQRKKKKKAHRYMKFKKKENVNQEHNKCLSTCGWWNPHEDNAAPSVAVAWCTWPLKPKRKISFVSPKLWWTMCIHVNGHNICHDKANA